MRPFLVQSGERLDLRIHSFDMLIGRIQNTEVKSHCVVWGPVGRQETVSDSWSWSLARCFIAAASLLGVPMSRRGPCVVKA